MYSESLIFRISFTNTHSFLIMSGFVSCMSLKNSDLLSPCLYQGASEISLTLRIKFGTSEECVILVFNCDSVRLVKTKNANSISSGNIMMTAYFNA